MGRYLGCARAIFHRKNHLPHAQFVAFLHAYFADRPRHRGGHFHDGFVRLEFHHRLALRNARARRNQQSNQIAALDVLA